MNTKLVSRSSRRARIASPQQLRLLQALHLAADYVHGYELMKATDLGPGTLYGLLRRLFEDGYLERTSAVVSGRCRIGYRLNRSGTHYAERIFIEMEYERGAAQIAAKESSA